MNLAQAFADSAQQHSSRTALYWGERDFTYAEFRTQSLAIATTLQESFGVRRGDRVALWMRNRPEFVPAMLGVLHAGAVLVPINNFLKPDEVNFILQDAGIDVLISDAELAAHFPALSAARQQLKLLNVDEVVVPDTPAALPPPQAASSDLAVIIYTSGTTGRPKGAMLSHGNLLHNIQSCRRVLRTVESDRFAVLLPMFHSYMLTVGLLLPLLVGASIVLVKSIHPVRNLLEDICAHQVTILPAIPQFYRSIVHAAQCPFPPSLRICISGAAPLPVQVLQEFERKFGTPLIEGYGLSEASPVVTKNPLDGTRKAGSIGLPIPDVDVSVQDDSGRLLPAREIGEICVRGGNVMLGYWNQPEETAKAIRNDWLLTGDIGYRDEEGYFYITDRKKDMLLVNGINVYPREIEEVIYQFPNVKEVAVIGVPDARRGEQPLAFVAPVDGTSLDEKALLHFVKERMADYKVPRRVVFLPALPRNATGKILKTALRTLPQAGS